MIIYKTYKRYLFIAAEIECHFHIILYSLSESILLLLIFYCHAHRVLSNPFYFMAGDLYICFIYKQKDYINI